MVPCSQSATLQVLGTFILWFCWYGFNPGSTLTVHGYSRDMARAAATTTLSAGSAAVTGLFLKHYLPSYLGGNGNYDLGHTCNSLLGGLVGITAGCSVIKVWGSIIVGFVAAFVYHGTPRPVRALMLSIVHVTARSTWTRTSHHPPIQSRTTRSLA